MNKDTAKMEEQYRKKLSTRIITLRKSKGLSQEKLATESEIARSLMRSYERKERNMSFGNLMRIIKLGLEMNVEEFFSEGFDKDVSAVSEKAKTAKKFKKNRAKSETNSKQIILPNF